jgi:adenine/guanine phosphoribosyltransferase-like PRPP-binding protein
LYVYSVGNTAKAVIRLLESLGAIICGVSCVYNQLPEAESFFQAYNFHFVVRIDPQEENVSLF